MTRLLIAGGAYIILLALIFSCSTMARTCADIDFHNRKAISSEVAFSIAP